MTSRLKRAAVSIVLNIAEGMSRRTEKDKARFINQAFSSAIEVIGILVLSHDLTFIDEETNVAHREKTEMITNKLNSLYNKFDK
ncbi:four helix bundle protein [Sphingobacterium wenxiniae]|uniref:Four helix bundle protein n=1 Tax=Sphingobacterium wenxiniae TaxID=683125 RepID=A0A1I6U774_9SPHI|nr:four helix bundle protein [Sphingobacterium wenxiniae]SFS97251.1 four helix bundle protein [Sphingobacterium wenxiniae]